MGAKHVLRHALAIFFAAITATAAVGQTALTADQMRHLAAQAVVQGNPQLGRELTGALLARNPNDTEALIIRARSERDLGRPAAAIRIARKAWSNADTASERFGSSMVMAQALSTSGARTRAQLWLRRAAQNAPNEELKQIAVRDFRMVRRVNPWSTELNFSISPSSNINNGSARSTSKLFDLPFEFQLSGTARALSGLQYSGGFATRYRLSETNRYQNDLIFQFDHRTFTLSPEAKRLAPTAKGSDFAFSSASLSYIRRGFSSADGSLPHQIEITAGRTWYAQQPFMEFARLAFTQNYVFSPGSFAFAGLSREYQRTLSTRADADNWTLSTGVRFATAQNDRVTFTLSGKQSNSLDPSLDFTQVTLGARYALAKPVAGISLDFGVSVAQKNHQVSRFSRFGREDTTWSFDATAAFSDVEYFGFSPTVTFTARQNDSSIGIYETSDLGIQMGIRSAF